MNLSDIILFQDMKPDEITELLNCLNTYEQSYKKGDIILAEGTITEHIGIILSGSVIISFDDIWGNTSILGNISQGSIFAEVYAYIPDQPMLVNVSAVEATTVLFMNVGHALKTCSKTCPYHTKLIRNLLNVCAYKTFHLSQRMQHISSKSIRGRLMSYFSECAKRSETNSFIIPFNRQQLADYLNVDRSTMCNELSKMQKDGIIAYEKNQIQIIS